MAGYCEKRSSRVGDDCYILFFDNGSGIMAADCAIFILSMEDNKVRKRILRTLLAIGAIVLFCYIYSLVFYRAHAEITRLHIGYQSNVQDSFSLIAVFLYLVATLFPFFISSIKRTSILGLIMCLSFLVSVVFYPDFMISVWCFFAAVISFFIFYTIRDAHKKFHFSN